MMMMMLYLIVLNTAMKYVLMLAFTPLGMSDLEISVWHSLLMLALFVIHYYLYAYLADSNLSFDQVE